MSGANGEEGGMSASMLRTIEAALAGEGPSPPGLPLPPAGDDVRALRAELHQLRAELPEQVRLAVCTAMGPRCGRCGAATPVLPVEYLAGDGDQPWYGWRLVPAGAPAWPELPDGVVSRICAPCARRVVLRQLAGASTDRVRPDVAVMFGPELLP